MARAATVTSESLWQEMRGEAQRAAASDAVFGSVAAAAVFAHHDFAAAVSDLICAEPASVARAAFAQAAWRWLSRP